MTREEVIKAYFEYPVGRGKPVEVIEINASKENEYYNVKVTDGYKKYTVTVLFDKNGKVVVVP